MDDDELSLLCTGDLHLGRHPTRVPSNLDGPAFSPKSTWSNIIQHALDNDVDAVVISGDIADRENRYFEAFGAFETGAARLTEADIPVITVAGNHDCDVFPRMVSDIDLDDLHLLGRDGHWERWTLENDGEPLIHFDGWSFPDEHVYTSPMEDYDLPAADGVPQIGVLHADLDSRDSQYAPVQSSELRSSPMTSWVLGHIHSPGVRITSEPLVLYPGSPQPLDPGEPDAHGPWILSIDASGQATAAQNPLASVRYDSLEVDVSGIDDPQGVGPLISDEIENHIRSISPIGPLELLLVRIQLTGRTSAHAELVAEQHRIQNQFGSNEGSVTVRIDSLEVDTRPAIDLEQRAEGDDAVAHIASLLLDLQRDEPSDSVAPLIDEATRNMQQAYNSNAYTLLQRENEVARPDRQAAADTLEQEAKVLLDTLLAQKESES